MRLHPGHGIEQGARIRMGGVAKQCLRAALFHNAALKNDGYLSAQVIDNGEVVADQQIGNTELILQVLHQIQNLGLHRHVKRADRFVCHDQSWTRDQGARNGNPLALST